MNKVTDDRLEELIADRNRNRKIYASYSETYDESEVGKIYNQILDEISAFEELQSLRKQNRALLEDGERAIRLLRNIESFVFSHNEDMTEFGDDGYLIRVDCDELMSVLDQHKALMERIEKGL